MKIKYQDKIIAFVDILGFSNIVYSDSTDSINNYFSYVLSNLKSSIHKNNFNYHLISDSIVISANQTQLSLQKMTRMLCTLQAHLLLDGLLIRGAISFGKFYENKTNNILVGPGLINAFKLESKAIYPRIILDRSLIKQYYSGTTEAIQDLEWVTYIPPIGYKSDFLYLSYTNLFSVYFGAQSNKLKKALGFLENEYYKNEHITKYEWLKIHLAHSFKKSIAHYESRDGQSGDATKRLRNYKLALDKIQNL